MDETASAFFSEATSFFASQVDLLGENPFADNFQVNDRRHSIIFTCRLHIHVYVQLKTLSRLQDPILASLEPGRRLLLAFPEPPPLALRHRGKDLATTFSSLIIATLPRGLLFTRQR